MDTDTAVRLLRYLARHHVPGAVVRDRASGEIAESDSCWTLARWITERGNSVWGCRPGYHAVWLRFRYDVDLDRRRAGG